MEEHTRWFPPVNKQFAGAPSMTISLVNGVNPLQTTLLELGIVSGRVALLLRSAEIQPVFGRFVTEWHCHSPPISPGEVLLPGGLLQPLALAKSACLA
jgi:hypothetical protein